MAEHDAPSEKADLRFKIHEVIFEADTPTGKYFDIALLAAILASVAAVSLELSLIQI